MLIRFKYQNNNGEYCYDSFKKIKKYDKVVNIDCSNNQLSVLPKLPNSLQKLYCYYNQLSVLPKLPNSLQTLCCYYNQLNVLPELPNSLKIINCFKNKFITKIKHRYLLKIIYL